MSARRTVLLAGLAAITSACGGATAMNLRPAELKPGYGAVFGHVEIWKDSHEVTGSCWVTFAGEGKKKGTVLSLDDSGWVFTSLPEGRTRLSYVSCAVWGGLSYGSNRLVFDVIGHGKTTYFGDVGLHLKGHDAEIWANALSAGAAQVPATVSGAIVGGAATTGSLLIESAIEPDGNIAFVDDRSDEAMVEYESRYGARGAFELFMSIAGRKDKGLQDSAPEITQRGDVVSVEATSSGVRLDWHAAVPAGGSSVDLQIRHRAKKPTLQACRSVDFVVDGVLVRSPASYRAVRDSYFLHETLQVDGSAALARDIASAKSVSVSVCGMTRVLSPTAIQATAKFVAAYDSLARSELARRAAAVPPDATVMPSQPE